MNRVLIRLLRGRKPGFVDAVVDGVVDPRVHLFDLVAQRLRPVIIGVSSDLVEGRIEHADDFGAFVRHDRLALLVPQDRHGHAARHFRIGLEVDVARKWQVVKLIAGRPREIRVERPAVAQHVGMHNRHADMRLELLELAEHEGAVRPWAGIADIEVIPSGFRRKPTFARRTSTAVSGDPVAELRCAPLELSARAFRVVALVFPHAVYQKSHVVLLSSLRPTLSARARSAKHRHPRRRVSVCAQ